MSMQRARNTVQASRNDIVNQIDQLARRAGVDRRTMALALQEGFNRELGGQPDEQDEGPRAVSLNISATITVDSDEDLDSKLEQIERAAQGFGLEDLEIDDNGGYASGEDA